MKTVIFTNFWDIEALLKQPKCPVERLSVYSIALGCPLMDKFPNVSKHFKTFERLDCFCPTYKLLDDYKAKRCGWGEYVSVFKNLLIERKSVILRWIDSLEENRIYVLCCWENTSSKDVHCHRQLIYGAFKNSARTKDKAIYIYRNGDETKDLWV